jgi:opacity protein-like surface antigen
MKKVASLLFLTVMLLLVVNVQAEGLDFRGIGGRLSLVKPENIDATIGLGVHADLGEIYPNIVFIPSIEYWKKGLGDSPGASSDVSAIQINADAKYMIPTEGNLDFFAGGGLAIVRNKVSTDIESVPGLDLSGSATNTDIGLNLLGGLDYPLSETLDLNALAVFTISDGSVFRITGGVMYKFRK